ncbi:pitrilysin family protein [uncultured Aquitalea sp.]|uniref:M16 family metallopeptidase n=1 Tax=uncultured Aquitalea sp. TaxID=540272 RepID=UPI0025ECC480|nr:pitrilysin family protein [uncultured Aquitalea sp.]
MSVKAWLGGVLLGCVAAQGAWALDVQRWVSPQGATVLLVEAHANPILDVRVDFDAGSRRDPQGKEGLAGMTAGLLDAGSPGWDEERLRKEQADIAAEIGTFADQESAGIRVRTLTRPALQQRALALANRLLTAPLFPQKVLDRERASAIEGLEQALNNGGSVAARALGRQMYGHHPYGNDDWQDASSLRRISREDLLAFWRARYQAQGAVVAIVGDIDKAGAQRVVDSLLQGLPKGGAAAWRDVPVVPESAGRIEHIAHPGAQTHIALGASILRREDPDYYALVVGNYVLGGGGFDSRLMEEVRAKRGLTYGVSSHFIPLEQAGPFALSLSTRNDQAASALKVVRQTLANFVEQGPTEAELKQAKDNILGGFPLRYDSNAKLLSYLSVMGIYSLPDTYLDDYQKAVAELTVVQVRDAWRRRIHPDKLALVTAGATPAAP